MSELLNYFDNRQDDMLDNAARYGGNRVIYAR